MTELTHHRFTVSQFEQMIEAGFFRKDEHIELRSGQLFDMCPFEIRESMCTASLSRLVILAVPDTFRVFVKSLIEMDETNELQPDLAVVAEHDTARRSTAGDTLLVVEVAGATLALDRYTKLPIYAVVGVAEAWMIDTHTGVVERHTEPHDGVHRSIASARHGETLASTVVPEIIIPVADILK